MIQAFSEHHHDEDEHGDEDQSNDLESHNLGVYKGLAAVIGIYVFFIIEKIMHMRRARKEKRVIFQTKFFFLYVYLFNQNLTKTKA